MKAFPIVVSILVVAAQILLFKRIVEGPTAKIKARQMLTVQHDQLSR